MDIATQLVNQFGYWGLGFSLVVNCMGVPIASEATLPISGMLVSSGTFDLLAVFCVAVAAQMLGLTLSYMLAYHGGIELLEKFGKYFFLRKKHIHKMQALFKKHGTGLILLGACTPGLHGYVGYPAGLAKMSLAKFESVAVFGVVIWTAAFLALGIILRDNLSVIAEYAHFVAVVILLIVMCAAIFWYIRRHNKKRGR